MMTTCHGHGRCNGLEDGCRCFAGWAGLDCQERALSQMSCMNSLYTLKVEIKMPVGSDAVSYIVSVSLENGEGYIGQPVETSVNVIGPPSSLGCDGVPNSGKTNDVCGECDGDGLSCAGIYI